MWRGLLAVFAFIDETPGCLGAAQPARAGGRRPARRRDRAHPRGDHGLLARLLRDAAVAEGVDPEVAGEATEPIAHAIGAAVQGVAAWGQREFERADGAPGAPSDELRLDGTREPDARQAVAAAAGSWAMRRRRAGSRPLLVLRPGGAGVRRHVGQALLPPGPTTASPRSRATSTARASARGASIVSSARRRLALRVRQHHARPLLPEPHRRRGALRRRTLGAAGPPAERACSTPRSHGKLAALRAPWALRVGRRRCTYIPGPREARQEAHLPLRQARVPVRPAQEAQADLDDQARAQQARPRRAARRRSAAAWT